MCSIDGSTTGCPVQQTPIDGGSATGPEGADAAPDSTGLAPVTADTTSVAGVDGGGDVAAGTELLGGSDIATALQQVVAAVQQLSTVIGSMGVASTTSADGDVVPTTEPVSAESNAAEPVPAAAPGDPAASSIPTTDATTIAGGDVAAADATAGATTIGTAPGGDVATILQQLITVLQQLVAALSATMNGSAAATAAPTTDATMTDATTTETTTDATLPEAPPLP
jgi:hypothetical protein